jgi:hypothetical protein
MSEIDRNAMKLAAGLTLISVLGAGIVCLMGYGLNVVFGIVGPVALAIVIAALALWLGFYQQIKEEHKKGGGNE